MANNELNDNDERPASSYVKYSSLGFQMIAVIGVFAFAGYKIDQSANHQVKWVTAALSLTGVFISLYIVIRSISGRK